jgi:chemotaxis protein methyltransferase CheR
MSFFARDAQPAFAMTGPDYSRFCDYIYQKTGIHFQEKKAYFVKRRLNERIEATGSATFRDYFSLLRGDALKLELQQLVNVLTVNETYFLREDYQFDALVSGILPELAAERGKGSTLRLWSMPCSTGEEPYSIAMQILERWPQSDEYSIEIAGTDIDSRVLAAAVAGRYGDRAMMRLPAEWKRKYFRRLDSDDYQICDELRESISFSVANIVEPATLRKMAGVDVIFCRNLLIYFDELSQRQAVESLYECLAPGGFICLGHSESMSRISSLFRPRRFGGVIVYQKPFPEDRRNGSPDRSAAP